MTTTTPTTTSTAPRLATWKGHGRPTGILWYGAVAKRSQGTPATVTIEDGDIVIRSLDGGRLDWFGSAGTFWAVTIPIPGIPAQTGPADGWGAPDPLASLKAELHRALPHMADCQPDLSVCLCSDGEREQIIDALMPAIRAHYATVAPF